MQVCKATIFQYKLIIKESGLSPETEYVGTLIMHFLASSTVRKKFLLLINYTVYGILLRCPKGILFRSQHEPSLPGLPHPPPVILSITAHCSWCWTHIRVRTTHIWPSLCAQNQTKNRASVAECEISTCWVNGIYKQRSVSFGIHCLEWSLFLPECQLSHL